MARIVCASTVPKGRSGRPVGWLGEKYDWLRRLLVRFGASDGSRFGQYQGSRRIG